MSTLLPDPILASEYVAALPEERRAALADLFTEAHLLAPDVLSWRLGSGVTAASQLCAPQMYPAALEAASQAGRLGAWTFVGNAAWHTIWTSSVGDAEIASLDALRYAAWGCVILDLLPVPAHDLTSPWREMCVLAAWASTARASGDRTISSPSLVRHRLRAHRGRDCVHERFVTAARVVHPGCPAHISEFPGEVFRPTLSPAWKFRAAFVSSVRLLASNFSGGARLSCAASFLCSTSPVPCSRVRVLCARPRLRGWRGLSLLCSSQTIKESP